MVSNGDGLLDGNHSPACVVAVVGMESYLEEDEMDEVKQKPRPVEPK